MRTPMKPDMIIFNIIFYLILGTISGSIMAIIWKDRTIEIMLASYSGVAIGLLTRHQSIRKMLKNVKNIMRPSYH